MWHKVNKKLPKKTDFYLISDGVDYSVAIYYKDKQVFIDKNISKPIEHNSIKYWSKISELPTEKSKYYNPMLRI